MSSLYTYFESGGDHSDSFYFSTGAAQTFTPAVNFTVDSIKIFGARVGDPGTITCYLKATNPTTGAPEGSALATGTLASSGIGLTNEWITITFTSAYALSAGTKYALHYVTSQGNTSNKITWYADNDGGYSGGSQWIGSTLVEVAGQDFYFECWGTATPTVDKIYSKKLVAIGGNEVWYGTAIDTMSELSEANQQINTGLPLMAVEAYQKIFIVNKTNKKVLDFVNTKINTADAGLNPCTPGMTLTGGTSTASMIVDYVDGVTDNAAMNVYGKLTTTATFSSGETVTGTNSAGNAVSFVTSAASTAPTTPHWYNWTTFGQNTTLYGTMLTQPTLVCLYRGRLVTSGDITSPHAWQMTKVGNPFKVLYDFDGDGDLSAVTYSNNSVGVVGDIITALIPYKDDLLIFGCANSLWILIGDPLAEGQLAEITNSTGIWGPQAWCIDDKKNLYFLGNDGVYQMPVGETSTPPTNISKSRLPQLITSLDLDKSLHRVVLSYDPVEYGIIISKTLLSDGTNTNYFFSLITNGFFPESYPASCGIFSSYYYPATDETYKKFLVGCTDGYIREFDGATKNDTTTSSTAAIGSYLTILQQMGPDENTNGMLNRFTGIIAGGASGGDFSDTDGVSYELHRGEDAETVLEDIKDGATAFTSGTWSATGKQNSVRPRLKGSWMGIKLYNSTASQTWAVEKLYGDVLPKGSV